MSVLEISMVDHLILLSGQIIDMLSCAHILFTEEIT